MDRIRWPGVFASPSSGAWLALPYDQVTLDCAARAAGTSRQTVLRHFGSKDALPAAVVVWQSPGDESARRGEPGDVPAAVAYDPAGRLTKLWAPGRPTSGPPTAEYAYSISKAAPSSVSSKTLGANGNQILSYEIYDGMLRPRQTQQTAPDEPAANQVGGCGFCCGLGRTSTS